MFEIINPNRYKASKVLNNSLKHEKFFLVFLSVLGMTLAACDAKKDSVTDRVPSQIETQRQMPFQNVNRRSVSLVKPADDPSCVSRVMQKADSVTIMDNCETGFDNCNVRYQKFDAGTAVCLGNRSDKGYWQSAAKTTDGEDVLLGNVNLISLEQYQKDDLVNNCAPTLTRLIEKKRSKIGVPSDPSATYIQLGEKTKSRYGHTLITTMRQGKSGVSYSTREINCSNWTFQYYKDGDSVSGYCASGSDGIMRPLSSRSISEHIANYACMHDL